MKLTCNCCNKQIPESQLTRYSSGCYKKYVCDKCLASIFRLLPDDVQLSYVKIAVEFRKEEVK